MSEIKRKHSKISIKLHESLLCIQIYHVKILFSIFIIAAFSFLRILQMKQIYENNYGIQLSRADCFVILNTLLTKGIVMLPAFLYILTTVLRYMDNPQFVLRVESRLAVWTNKIVRIIIFSLLVAVGEALCIIFVSLCLIDGNINWGENGSLFWALTGETLSGISFIHVAVMYAVMSFFFYLFSGILFAFGSLIFRNLIIGWIIIGLCITEYYIVNPIIFYKRTSIYYERWFQLDFYNDIGIMFIIILLLSIVGAFLSKRKEFWYGR